MSMEVEGGLRRFADACVGCGLCARTDCGNFGPDAPNLGEICASLLSGDEAWRHFPFTCALCNRCTTHCPAGLRAFDMCKPARALLLRVHPELRGLYRKFRTDLKYNLFSMLKSHRAFGDMDHISLVEGTADLGGEADACAFFPGCALYAYAPELTDAVAAWLREEGIASRTLTFCCGATFYDPGFFDEFDAYAHAARAFLAERGIKRLVVTCPHCERLLPELLEGTGIELVRLPELLRARGKMAGCGGKITFHDSCYDREGGAWGAAARALYPHAGIVEMAHNRVDTMCCGGGGMVSAYARDYCEYRRLMRLAEVDDTGADACLSTCFSCVNSMQRSIREIPVRHYLEPVFGVEVDWPAVYASVDALYADARTEGLYASREPVFAGQVAPDEPETAGPDACAGAPAATAGADDPGELSAAGAEGTCEPPAADGA